jgi:hypothetical protein
MLVAVFTLPFTDPMLVVGYRSKDHVIIRFEQASDFGALKDQTQAYRFCWPRPIGAKPRAATADWLSRSNSLLASFYRGYLRFIPLLVGTFLN